MNQHVDQTSFHMKLHRLINFKNFLYLTACIVGVLFLFTFMYDLMIVLIAYSMTIIYRMFFSRNCLYVIGGIISLSTLIFRYKTASYRYMIFESYTPIFGLFVLSGMLIDIFNHNRINIHYLYVTLSGLYLIMALYHLHWLIGVMCVLSLFMSFGFVFGTIPGGYYSGFKRELSLQRCLIVAFVLVIGYIFLMFQIPTNPYLLVFESGVLFYGTFIELLSLLILSDEYYLKAKSAYSPERLIWMQLLMMITLFLNIYLGNVLNQSSMRVLGGTFLVFWALDIERMIVTSFRTIRLSGLFLIVFLNIMGLIYYICNYPEYFIL